MPSQKANHHLHLSLPVLSSFLLRTFAEQFTLGEKWGLISNSKNEAFSDTCIYIKWRFFLFLSLESVLEVWPYNFESPVNVELPCISPVNYFLYLPYIGSECLMETTPRIFLCPTCIQLYLRLMLFVTMSYLMNVWLSIYHKIHFYIVW